VLEVDTPVVVGSPVTDVHIHSARVQFEESARTFFLHTSPEYAMKRLLAAGSGDIYQICHVARGYERSRIHNAEFTLVEWYRLGYSLGELMDEVAGLVAELVNERRAVERISYQELFLRETGLDVFMAPHEALSEAASTAGFKSPQSPGGVEKDEEKNLLLDFLMGAVIGPRLGKNGMTFVYGYPASQAALAQLDPRDPRTALRFELYLDGVELANGFKELASATEQRTRFEHDIQQRQERALPTHNIDENLLDALAAGLPDCAGVALGFDRVLMIATGARTIDEVLTFPTEHA